MELLYYTNSLLKLSLMHLCLRLVHSVLAQPCKTLQPHDYEVVLDKRVDENESK